MTKKYQIWNFMFLGGWGKPVSPMPSPLNTPLLVKERAYHPEESLVGEAGVLVDGGEHAEDQADQHDHEPKYSHYSGLVGIMVLISEDSSENVAHVWRPLKALDK